MSDAAGNLRAASAAVALIRRRDPRAWPIALWLAKQDRARCLAALLDEMTGRAVPEFTPVLATEADLIEVFGKPAERSRRTSKARPQPTESPTGLTLLRRMAEGAA